MAPAVRNASDNDFDTILREGQAATRRVLDQELAKLTTKTAIYDPLSAFKTAPSLSETVSAGGGLYLVQRPGAPVPRSLPRCADQSAGRH